MVTIAAVVVSLAGSAQAQAKAPGDLDPSFGGGDVVTTQVGTDGGANAVALQQDGRILLAGKAKIEGSDRLAVIRHLPDGELDRGFGEDGIVTMAIGEVSAANGVTVQPDGKIVVAGSSVRPTGELEFLVVRLNRDGTPDRGFGDAGVVRRLIGSSALAMAAKIYPDGRIVATGMARVRDHAPTKLQKMAFAALALEPDGSIARSYGDEGIVIVPGVGVAHAATLQADGKLVLAGETEIDGRRAAAAARLTETGELDPSFGDGGRFTLSVGEAVQPTGVISNPDGSIVLLGPAWTGKHVTVAIKLTAAGSLEPGFGNAGIASFVGQLTANGAARQENGAIVIATTGGLGAIRLEANGAPDLGFGEGGLARYPRGDFSAANGIAIQPDGMIVLGGAVISGGSMRFAVARIVGGVVNGPAPEEDAQPPTSEPLSPQPPGSEPPQAGGDSADPDTEADQPDGGVNVDGSPRKDRPAPAVVSIRRLKPGPATRRAPRDRRHRRTKILIEAREGGTRITAVQLAQERRGRRGSWRGWTGSSQKVKLGGRPRKVHVRVRDAAGNSSVWKTARLSRPRSRR